MPSLTPSVCQAVLLGLPLLLLPISAKKQMTKEMAKEITTVIYTVNRGKDRLGEQLFVFQVILPAFALHKRVALSFWKNIRTLGCFHSDTLPHLSTRGSPPPIIQAVAGPEETAGPLLSFLSEAGVRVLGAQSLVAWDRSSVSDRPPSGIAGQLRRLRSSPLPSRKGPPFERRSPSYCN